MCEKIFSEIIQLTICKYLNNTFYVLYAIIIQYGTYTN